MVDPARLLACRPEAGYDCVVPWADGRCAMTDQPTAETPPHRPPCVLLAEDQAVLCSLLSTALSGAGFRVRVACHGDEVVIVYQAHRDEIDAALIDRGLPGKDGPAAMAELRALDPALPCCLMTGAGPDVEDELMALGASCVLTKPFDLPELIAKVRGLCARAAADPSEVASSPLPQA
jgi:DNA-binding response OmpR family regulator